MIEENFEEMPLEELGEQITRRASAVDDQILSTAELICVARKRVESELAGQTTWTEWARTHIKLSGSRQRDLQRIAEAEDPQQELKRQRDLTRKRVEKHREKQKGKPAVPLPGSGDKTVEAPAKPETGHQVPTKTDSEPGDGHLEERTNEPPLRNGGEDAGAASSEAPDLRRLLIRWAEDAPPEEIEKVWVFVQGLEPAASSSDPEKLAAVAA